MTDSVFGNTDFAFGPGNIYWDTATGGEDTNLGGTVSAAHFLDETIKALRAAGSTAEDFSALRYAADLSGI